jgi:hypothetical protein
MNSSKSRAALGRSMRVATTFIGAAACTAAVAPTANAQTADKLASHLAQRPANDAGIRPGPCSGGPSWLHLYFAGGGDSCFGYQGTWSITSPGWVTGFCGGNNYGYLSGLTTDGRHLRQDFGPAANPPKSIYHFTPPKFPSDRFFVSKVHISSWTNHGSCPA